MSTVATGTATAADLLALGEDRFHEVVGGELVRRADPSGEHGGAQADLSGLLFGAFRLGPPGGGAGGWWFATEVEVELEAHEVYRPDLVGWRRERVPRRPTGSPVRVRPDWVCEVLSETTAARDRGLKFDAYHRAGLPHYWIVDPRGELLTVHRHTSDGYLVVLNARRGQRVRAEPFEAIEIPVGLLFGDDAGA